jgi:hypothetical protein
MIDHKQTENEKYFNYFCSTITNNARAAFNKKTLFTRKLDLNLRKKPVKCYMLSIALYGAETGTFRKIDQKYTGKYRDVVLEKNIEDHLD